MASSCQVQAVFYNNPDTYPPIVNSVRLLARAGLGLSLFCRENSENCRVCYPPAAKIWRIDGRNRSSWREYLHFVAQVMKSGDSRALAFIGHDMHGFLPARLLATRHRRPLIYHCHDLAERRAPLQMGGRVVRMFEQQFARTADLVIVPDAGRAKVVQEQLCLRAMPMLVANAPLNQPITRTGALRTALAAQGYGWERVVLRQGMIGVGHGIEATVRSLPMWTDPNSGFVVIGLGKPDYLMHLRSLAASLGVAQRFAILPPVGYDDLLSYTVDADVGHALYDPIHVNNIYITTASNKLMEYMAAGIPVIASVQNGMRAFVESHNCGVTADESSPEGIARAVNTLLDDRDTSRRMGDSGRRTFENELCYERQFAPVLEAIRRYANNAS